MKNKRPAHDNAVKTGYLECLRPLFREGQFDERILGGALGFLQSEEIHRHFGLDIYPGAARDEEVLACLGQDIICGTGGDRHSSQLPAHIAESSHAEEFAPGMTDSERRTCAGGRRAAGAA